MSVTSAGPPAAQPGPSPDAQSADTVVLSLVPERADGVELLGSMRGSGYRVPPALVRRADGQTLQLTPLLYALLEAIDGRRSFDELAEILSRATNRAVSAENVRQLVDGKLRPLGVLRNLDGTQPDVRKANPLLALRFRYVVSNPRVTRRITAPFAILFHPVVVAVLTLAFVAVSGWVLFRHGLAAAAHQAFDRPGLLLAVFAITVLSAGFHEFGHAAAARYGGATPGAMGMGIYLAWPAFYTDVTDAYRLGRGGRIRTDLGGLYFNAVVAVAMFGVWAGTGWDALLLVIATQLIQMLRQLPPLLRFDGYHILADVTGVPDLFHRIGPTLAGLLPTRWRDPRTRILKPWARAVVTLWVLVVVPLMLLMVLVSVLTLPRILASAGAGLRRQWQQLSTHVSAGDIPAVLANLLGVVAIAVPILGISVMVFTTVRRTSRSVWHATEGRPVRRGLAGVVAAAIVTALAFAWWPHGNYRAISANERGVLQQAFGAKPAAVHTTLTEGQRVTAKTLWPSSAAGSLPTKDHPALALVMVPRDPNSTAPTWVFPFDRPAPPGVGDNQALAVNTKNGSTVYDVAFAMVWADGDTVLDKNEAYAFADCTDCTTVAVAFQVVLVVGQADVIVPQNLSGTLNYNCVQCVTGAIAMQLVVTIPDDPSPELVDGLAQLWQQIDAFSKHLQGLTFQQIHDQLAQYEQQIVELIQKYAPSASASSAVATGNASASTSVSVSGSGIATSGVSTDVAGATDAATATSSGAATSSAPAPTDPVVSAPLTPAATP